MRINDNDKVLAVVDEALTQYGSDLISVDLNCGMIDVNICNRHSSDVYMAAVARFDKINKKKLEAALDKRNVDHCW